MTNTIAANVSINYHCKNIKYKGDCFILDTISLGITLLLIITIICNQYAKCRSKQISINTLTIEKWKIMNLKSSYYTCYYFNDN